MMDGRIGILNENTLHAALKRHYDPCEEHHEIAVDSYVADIYDGRQVIEIQTQGFEKIRTKLKIFLEKYPVTVVYPVARTKRIRWTDPETGAVSAMRKSHRAGNPCRVFFELYKIKQLLTHSRLCLCIVMLDWEEHRILDGYGKDRKRGSTCLDKIPLCIGEEIRLEGPADYQKIIPVSLPGVFDSEDFRVHSRLSLSQARHALHVLHYVGAVERIGKTKNRFIYQRMKDI